MIGVDRFASVFGGAPAHTAEHLTEHVRAIVRAGYSPVFCKPGGKEAACILSAGQAKKADREAQQLALATNPAAQVDRIRHACGMKHVIDDPAKVGPIVKRFVEVHGGLNIGLHLGRSRMLVVDVDTPAERQAFAYAYESAGGQDGANLTVPGITVESPGTYDQVKQEWVHWGGGHWWMDLPDDFELPAGKVAKGPGGWAAMWGEAYALVPPASRPEGSYRLVGGTTAAPAWLLDVITTAGEDRAHDAEARRDHARLTGGAIDQWSAATSWASLLEPQGWTETSLVEGSCGCPIWTAPGDHASPKSATAHDLACARFDVSEGWGPLKIWTDHPPEGLPPEGAVTKLQFVAATGYGGNDVAAMKGLGLEFERTPLFAVPDSWQQKPPVNPPETPWSNLGEAPNPTVPPVADAAPGDELSSWEATDLRPYLDGSYVPPEPTLLVRSDGQGLLYPGRTHSIYGEPESGKTWIGLLAVAQALQRGEFALVVDLESDPGELTHRLMILGCSPGQIGGGLVHISPASRPGPDDVAAYQRTLWGRTYAVVLIDALAGAMGLYGLDPKSDVDVTTFYRSHLPDLSRRSGACVIVIDHVIKDPDARGRWSTGSERKIGALTGAALSVRSDRSSPFGKGRRGESGIWLAKDRGGGLRGMAGEPDKNGMQPVGDFVLDASFPLSTLGFIKAPLVTDSSDDGSLRPVMDRIVEEVKRWPGISKSALEKGCGGNKTRHGEALNRLVDLFEIRVENAGRSHSVWFVEACDRPQNIGEMSG